MLELLEFAFTGINIVPTSLVVFSTVYWLIVILGVIDVDAVDFDLDMDVDADVDIDADVEVGHDVSVSGMASVLSFFNIGHMPLMIFVTFFSIPLWAVTLIANDLFGIESFIPGLITFIPSFILSLFIAKILTTPIAKFYRNIRTQTEAVDIVGQLCTAKLPINPDKDGQAEIKVKGTSVLISARTRDDNTVKKGETALVIEFNEKENFYIVEPYQL